MIEWKGSDFLFLFDLVACTCGRAATLRVLSYTSASFENLCQPRLVSHKVQTTETSIKIFWQHARLQDIKAYYKLKVDEYIVTIFPGYDFKSLSTDAKEAEFRHLEGGTIQYTITVSAIVGQAKMKGVTYKSYLPPYPPQNLQCYPSDVVTNKSTSVKITWTSPRGDFHKYSLRIVLLGSRGDILRTMSTKENLLHRNPSSKLPDEIWLPKDVNEHLSENLKPGERYQIELKSMTDYQKCLDEKAPKAVVLTKPLPPSHIIINSSVDQAEVQWSPPESDGHSCLVGYVIQVRVKDNSKLIEEKFVSIGEPRQLAFKDLLSSVEYEVVGYSVCRNVAKKVVNVLISQPTVEIRSDPVLVTFVTYPRPPQNLRLENAQASSLKIKWDAPTDCCIKPSFTVSLHPLDDEVMAALGDDIHKDVDSNTFTFSKLPEIVGSGKKYEIGVKTTIQVNGKILQSEMIKKTFITKPLPPDKLEIVNSNCQEFSWRRSKTKLVEKYKFKVKKDDERPVDYFIDDNVIQEESEDCSTGDDWHLITFRVPAKFEEGCEYKIYVHSLLDIDNNVLESEPCQARVSRLYENCEVTTLSTYYRMLLFIIIKCFEDDFGA